jgi:hypothetical protein
LVISSIDAPHECALLQKVDYVNCARILRQSKQVSCWQAQDPPQSEANDAGVGDYESASTSIRCDDLAYPRGDALPELRDRLGARDRLVWKPLDP